MTQPLEILLIEDNEGDVIMVQRALRQVLPACNLQVVNDGTEALELLFERSNFQNGYRPHLILLDLNLPGINGKEALNIIKCDEHMKTIPVVVLTSSKAPSDIQESYALHANCYVVKPFDGKEFKGVLVKIVDFWRSLVLLPHVGATL